MKIYKKPIFIVLIATSVFIIILLNFKNVGRPPELYNLSDSVAHPGDTITLKGNYFGKDISKGQIFINDQILFSNYIKSWSNKDIVLKLPDDFKSGMIHINNMFGESDSLLLTSYKDVPRIRTNEEIPGFPFIKSAKKLVSSDFKIHLSGRNFGSRQALSSLVVSNSNDNDGDGFSDIPDEYIVRWSDDTIVFYMPYGIRSKVLYVRSSKGFSNYFTLPVRGTIPVVYEYGISKKYNLKQKVELNNIVALENSSISIFIPCVLEDLNQKNVLLSSTGGTYNKLNNTFDHKIDIKESGKEFWLELDSYLDVYSLTTSINKRVLSKSYDKESPQYISGYQTIPGVIEGDKDTKSTSRWLIRNSKNYYNRAEIIINWIIKYIKMSEDGTSLSNDVLKNKMGSSKGLVKLTTAMLRAGGIPSRIISGIKVEETVENYLWLEFFLPGGGWIPMDIVKAKSTEDNIIGSLDYNRIAFTKGVVNIKYQNDNFEHDLYALQNCVSNSEGNIENYDAVWHNVEIE